MTQLSLLEWSPVTKARKRGPATSKAAARRAQPGCSKQLGGIRGIAWALPISIGLWCIIAMIVGLSHV